MDTNSLIEICRAEVIKKSKNLEISEISTDTRTIKKNDFYLPLKGDNFNGENFIPDSIKKGAVGYFTTSDTVFEDAEIVLKVGNTLDAYFDIATFMRNSINPTVIAITGSAGKTTVKEMTASVCAVKFKTHKTALNCNNEVGFCQTLVSMPKDTQVLVVEMGMRGLGQIELLSKHAIPNITIISNVGTAHIGILGSKENIAKAKCEITKFQNPNGVFISPDDRLIKSTVRYEGKKIFFSGYKIIEQREGFTKFEYKSKIWEINIEGEYNVSNAICAIEAGLALNMDYDSIFEGLKKYRAVEKRWETEIKNGYKIIKDCYNANPDSVKSALKTVFNLYPDSVIVLGNMGELGEYERFYHQEVGEFIKQHISDYRKLITVGDLAKEISDINSNSINFETNEQAAEYILNNVDKNTTVFLKASRVMKFEEISEMIGSEE